MTTEVAELAHRQRAAQFGMPLLLVILVAILIIGAVIILATTRLTVQFNISERTLEEDQKPALQALSYRTVAFLNHFPVSYYDLAAVSAATGKAEYDVGETRLVAQDALEESLSEFSETTLGRYSDHCFDYALGGRDGAIIFTEMLYPGLYAQQAENCTKIEESLGEQGMVAIAKKGNSYFIPVPPFIDKTARLTAQFIYDLSIAEGHSATDSDRPFCLEIGAEAASRTECCSGFVSPEGRCSEPQ